MVKVQKRLGWQMHHHHHHQQQHASLFQMVACPYNLLTIQVEVQTPLGNVFMWPSDPILILGYGLGPNAPKHDEVGGFK